MPILKIHGGTRSGVSLCHTCRHAHVRRGSAMGQELVVCQDTYPHVCVTYPVVECNAYRDRTLASLKDMTDIATLVNSDRRTGQVGFSSPEQDKRKDVKRDVPDNPFD